MSLQQALELCGLRLGERFAVAALDRAAGDFEPACFSDVAEAAAWLSEQQGRDLYVTGNPLRAGVTGRPFAADVVEQRVCLIDLDPADSSPEAAEAVKQAARRVAELTLGAHVFSGRGHQIWARIAPGVDPERLVKGMRKRYSGDGVKIDGTFDASRLMRLPGSVNTRTGATAGVVWDGGGQVEAGDLDAWGLPTLAELTRKVPKLAAGEATERDRLWLDRSDRLASLWRSETGDRSTRDALFVLEGLRAGVPSDSLGRLLYALPGGKGATERRDAGYWTSTWKWARAELDTQERQAALVEGLAAGGDAAAVFQREALKALAAVRDADPEGWPGLRSRLGKIDGVRLSDLDSRISAIGRGPAPPVRAVYASGELLGYYYRLPRGEWIGAHRGDVSTFLAGSGHAAAEILARALGDPWTRVAIPFAPEEDYDARTWNKGAAAFAVAPEAGPCPTWDRLFEIVGGGIDGPAQAAGFEGGAHYLWCWAAWLFRDPARRLPMLFLYSSKQDTGKSMFHESLRTLFDEGRGAVSGDLALEAETFNAELAGAVLCYVEEVKLNTRKGRAYNRIKEWTSAPTIRIREMRTTAYQLPNYTHWVQCSNDHDACPMLPGDTRVVAIEVEGVSEEEREPKPELQARIEAERPQALAKLLALELPAPVGRLTLPVLATRLKSQIESDNRDELQAWLAERPAEALTLPEGELVELFLATLPASRASVWGRRRVLRGLRSRERQLVQRLEALAPWSGTSADLLAELDAEEWTAKRLGKALRRLAGTLGGRLTPEAAPRGRRRWIYSGGA